MTKINLYPNGNIIPITPNGKVALVSWKAYQSKSFPKEELEKFTNCNYAILCGRISENLLIIDPDFKNKTYFEYGYSSFKEQFPELAKTYMVSTPHGYHLYYYMKGFSVDRKVNKNIISRTVKDKEIFCGLVKTKFAEYLKGVDFLGNNGYALIPPSKIDNSQYAPFTNFPIKEISEEDYNKIADFFLLENPIQMRKPFIAILNGDIEIEQYATKHNKEEFIYWKFLFREAYHFCKLVPEELFSFLKKNQPTFSIEKTNYQLKYHSYMGKVLSNVKMKEYFPQYHYNSNNSHINGNGNHHGTNNSYTLSDLNSYLSEFLAQYKYIEQSIDPNLLSRIRIKLLNLLAHINTL